MPDITSGMTGEDADSDTVLRVCKYAYRQINGGYSITNLARIPTLKILNVAQWRAVPFVLFITFVVLIPAIGFFVVLLSIPQPPTCMNNACPAIANLHAHEYSSECAVLELNNNSLISCSYWVESNLPNSTCNDVCPPYASTNAESLYCAELELQDEGSLRNNPDFYKYNNLTQYTCYHDCNTFVCPPQLTARGFLLVAIPFFGLISIYLFRNIRYHAPRYFPATPMQLLRKLTHGLDLGTFFVSYSWGGGEAEQSSKDLVSRLAVNLPCCWWDKEQLMPGASVEATCRAAASNCTVGFVFLSLAYLQSGICRIELDSLRRVRGRIVAFMHSDAHETKQGQQLEQELLLEDHCVFVIRPRSHTDKHTFMDSVQESLAKMTNMIHRKMGSICGRHGAEEDDTNLVEEVEYCFPLGGGDLGTLEEFLFVHMCTRGVLQKVFQLRSPPMNDHWMCTSSVLCAQMSMRRTVRMYGWLLSLPVTVLTMQWLWHLWESHVLSSLVVAPAMGVYAVVIFVVMSRVHLPPDSRLLRWSQHPHVAHLLVVLHSIGVVVPRAVKQGSVQTPRKTSAEADPGKVSAGRGANSNDANTGYVDIVPGPIERVPEDMVNHRLVPGSEYTAFRGEWYLPGGIKPPPLLVDLGELKARKLNFLSRQKVVQITNDSRHADIRFVRLHSSTVIDTVDDMDRMVFWTSCAFTELSPTTQATLRDVSIETAVGGEGPSTESIVCNIIMRQLHIESSRILTGPLRWQSRDFRKTALDDRESDVAAPNTSAPAALTG
eukprot:m.962400 g.962400  ORF g.962400 m.962400 type:complete len:775 (-) comp23891_c0_seq1:221-2545(-)